MKHTDVIIVACDFNDQLYRLVPNEGILGECFVTH